MMRLHSFAENEKDLPRSRLALRKHAWPRGADSAHGEGTTWKYEMTQEFGEGVKLSDASIKPGWTVKSICPSS